MEAISKKKGVGLGDLYPAVLAIVILGILLGVGIYTMTQTALSISTTSFTVGNETLTPVNAGTAVSTADDCGFQTFAITTVTNATSGAIIQSGNYTAHTNGKVANLTGYYPGTWNVTYSYVGAPTATGGACSALTTSATGIGTFAGWIAVIVVVLAAAIVLGIVINSFGGKNSV
jgi:hypothetical protein